MGTPQDKNFQLKLNEMENDKSMQSSIQEMKEPASVFEQYVRRGIERVSSIMDKPSEKPSFTDYVREE